MSPPPRIAAIGPRRFLVIYFLSAALLLGTVGAIWAQDGTGPTARALVVALDRAVLSAELTARISEMPVRPGDTFAEGDRLIRFDCRVFAAQRDVGAADLQAAETRLESARKLLTLNAGGPLDVAVAEAERDRAAAQLRLYQETVNRCSVRAPFDGRVVTWHARPHEIASLGVELIEVLASEGLELEMIVPSAWLSWLEVGLPISLSVDETGEAYGASVAVIGAEVDPVSQTVALRARFDAPPPGLLPGMSGVAIFPVPDRS
jgi:membrane fusion protein (multidrug efflux system)